MAEVKITSYRKEREAEIMGGLEKAMVAVKALVQRQAIQNLRQIANSHPWQKTGQLRGNVAEYSHMEDRGLTAVIGTNLPYGYYLEVGHIQHPGQFVKAIGKRLVAEVVPPYPWLFPAVEMQRDKILEILKDRGFTVA